MSQVSVLDHDPRRELLWSLARWSAFLAVPVLLVLLLRAPAGALTALWYVAIPILPATFFLSPALWRGICPLATLNEWGNRIGTQRVPAPGTARLLSVAGLALFHILVPARRVLFNESGVALAIAVVGVGALAVVLGAIFQTRSAFCNALCPVLPVEQLYGQAPLLSISRGRCATCVVCTPRGCLDLSEGKVLPQLLGSTRKSRAWLLTPFGVFAAALPGFIVGYNLVQDGPLSSAGRVYGATLGSSAASYALTALVVTGLRLRMTTTAVLLAAAAGGLYYWFSGPAIAQQLHAGTALSAAIRVAGLGVVIVWLAVALRRDAGVPA